MSTTTHPAAATPVEQLHVPLDRIRPPAKNVRTEFGDLDGLVASIRRYGIIAPLVVVVVEDGQYELRVGQRRYRAAHEAGCETVPVIVRTDAGERERVGVQLAENVERLELTSQEILNGIQEFLDLGATDEEVATTLGGTPDEVATLRTVLALGEPICDLITDGVLQIASAAPLAALSGFEVEYLRVAADKIRARWAPDEAVRQVVAMRKRDQVIREAEALAERRGLRVIDGPQYGNFGPSSQTQKLGSGLWDVHVPVKEHSKLDCHAVCINPQATAAKAALLPVCTDRRKHREATPDALADTAISTGVDHGAPRLATPAEKAVETKRHGKAWRQTHAPRTAAILDTIPTLPLDDAMARVAHHVLQERVSLGVSVEAARLLPNAEEEVIDPTIAERLIRDTAARGGEAALRTALAVLTARAEEAFRQEHRVDKESRNVFDHFALLAGHGYEVKEAETNHLRREYGTTLTLAAREDEDAGGDNGVDDGEGQVDDEQVDAADESADVTADVA